MGSTKESIQVETCSACHPFFTGKKTLLDTEGRVDKFRQKMAASAATKDVKKSKVRRKKTLEERVNEEISAQLKKEKSLEA